MGNRCFRPTSQNNDPVYISSLNLSFEQAEKIQKQKNPQKFNIIQEIQKNQNRKGNLKKLFDHLLSHQKNIFPSINHCNKKVSQQQNLSHIIIANLFCKQLVKLLTSKKNKLNSITTQQNINKTTMSSKNFIKVQFSYRNLVHQLQSHFLQLVAKILLFNNKQNQLKNSVSQTLIEYSNAFDDKLTSKKELKQVLDIYLTVIFQKNIQLINKNSYLPFYAYSSLLSKSKSQLFTSDFIQKHFNFIIKLFFELQECKQSNKSITQSQDFSLFQQSVQTIIGQFLLFSTQNKKIKDLILNQIMNQQDIQKFDKSKTQKLQRLIQTNLNEYNRQHFMFDWLGLLIKYIGRKFLYEKQNYHDSLKDIYLQGPRHNSNTIVPSIKNINTLECRINCIDMLKRWFTEELINIEKTLEYYSESLFKVLLFNLYNPNGNNEELSKKSQEVLEYILDLRPQKLTQILCLLNKKLRKAKNQCFPFQPSFITNQNSAINFSPPRKRSIQIIQQQTAIQVLWQNDLSFLLSQSKSQKFHNIFLTYQQIQQIYQKISISIKGSTNLIYLIELAGVSFNYIKFNKEYVENVIYKFLLSFTSCSQINNQQLAIQFVQNLISKMKFSFQQLYERKKVLLYAFLKYNYKKVVKQNNKSLWLPIFITVIVINLILQKDHASNSAKTTQLNELLRKIIYKIDNHNYNSTQIYQLFESKRDILKPSDKKLQQQYQNRLKQLQKIQDNIMGLLQLPKSVPAIQDSVVQSNVEFSNHQNGDNQFKNVIDIVRTP